MTDSAADKDTITTMKALVFHGPNKLALEDRPRPALKEATDVIVEHAFKVVIKNGDGAP